jgi:hypothetical protein
MERKRNITTTSTVFDKSLFISRTERYEYTMSNPSYLVSFLSWSFGKTPVSHLGGEKRPRELGCLPMQQHRCIDYRLRFFTYC